VVDTDREVLAVNCLDVYSLMFEPTDSRKLERIGDSKNPLSIEWEGTQGNS